MKRPIYANLYFQVLLGIALGVIFGFVSPARAAEMRPLGDGFIKLVKMLIAPIVFTTVVVGIAHMGAMKDVGRIGLRALVYFEVVSTVALAIGLVVVTSCSRDVASVSTRPPRTSVPCPRTPTRHSI